MSAKREPFRMRGVRLPPLKSCPLCGSRSIHRIKINKQWPGTTIRNIPSDACDNCGEKFLDPHALNMLRR